MNAIETDKSFAVFSDANVGRDDGQANMTENLIHESGRMQLNTYQAFVKDFMNPQSNNSSLMLVHMTGTGKTITALATATEYVKQFYPSSDNNSIASIIVLGFTKNIFKDELLSHPEFLFVNIDEASELKTLELHMQESETVAEQYYQKRRRYYQRLSKREVRGIYQFYGYRQFANRIINMGDMERMMKKMSMSDSEDMFHMDPSVLTKWIANGDVAINIPFIQSLSKSLIICDEVHNLYKSDQLNTYGIAINCVLDFFRTTTDPLYNGAMRSLFLSATPLTSSALEIIPIISLLTGAILVKDKLFTMMNGVEQLTAKGLSTIRQAIAGHISYIMDDNPREYPSSKFQGDSIKNIPYLKFIRTTPTGVQLECFKQWSDRVNIGDDRGHNMIKDIVLPPIEEAPSGTIFSRLIPLLANLPSNKSVKKVGENLMSSNIFKLSELGKYSSKYAKLVRMCIDMKGPEHGKMFVYHPYVQGSGTDMISSILMANGFVMAGDVPTKDSICMNCSTLYGEHSKKNHEFVPVCFTFINGNISKQLAGTRLTAFNNDLNVYGEKIKIIVGSKAMRESHTLKACRHIVIVHEPSSISEMVQIIGRAVRKKVHSMLPAEMRTVSIYILTTNVSSLKNNDQAMNEEAAYEAKMLQYIQINKVDRLLYDVSVDYLINFRFKMRETPPLLGEAYPLDTKKYEEYRKILSTAYDNMRKGTTLHGIHTSRFNIFYLEGESRLVMMLIKRILLDYQPVVPISMLKQLIRTPPFQVEYNTELIADESIAIAIHQIVFGESQLRIMLDDSSRKLSDTRFDTTSIVIDHRGKECRIVCIGDPFCSDAYVALKRTTAIIDGDASILDIFKNPYTEPKTTIIDIKQLADTLSQSMNIDDILYEVHHAKSIAAAVKNFSIPSHALLAQWAIKLACDMAIHRSKPKDISMVRDVIDFYQEKKLIFTIGELKHTKIYDRFKKYDTTTSNGWWETNTKPSLSKLPVGHVLGEFVYVYHFIDKSWLTLSSLVDDIMLDQHPYKWFIYYENTENTLDVVAKVKLDNDKKSRGITMQFLQKSELDRIAKSMKLKISPHTQKKDIIDAIIDEAMAVQKKIYPKRVIYSLVET